MVWGGALLLSGCGDKPDPASLLERRIVRSSTFEVILEEAGNVEATRVISIITPESAQLLYLPETGAMVEKDQVIVQLETQRAEESLQQRLNELKSVQAELEGTIESLKIAMRENTLNRDLAQSELEFSTIRLQDVKVRLAETEVLLESAVVPEDDVRSAQFDVDSTRLSTVTTDLTLRSQVATNVQERADRLTQIGRSELRGRRALRVLDQAQKEIDQATIRAPISGIFVRTRNWSWRTQSLAEPRPGEEVRRGQELGQIPDLASLVIKTQIPESYLLRVSEGTRATVQFDAHNDLKLEGTVTFIGNVAIDRETSAGGAIVQTAGYSGQKVFEVTISLDEVDPRLRPGITAQVRIVLDSRQGVLTVPVEAIRKEDEGTTVLVMNPEGRMESRKVTLGDHNGTEVIVLDGLRAGESIAVRRVPADASSASNKRRPA